jgi:hypothetical protein
MQMHRTIRFGSGDLSSLHGLVHCPDNLPRARVGKRGAVEKGLDVTEMFGPVEEDA